MRMHGSVLPRMIIPLFWITCWATLITCISKFFHSRKPSPLGPRRSTLTHYQWLSILFSSQSSVLWLVWPFPSEVPQRTNVIPMAEKPGLPSPSSLATWLAISGFMSTSVRNSNTRRMICLQKSQLSTWSSRSPYPWSTSWDSNRMLTMMISQVWLDIWIPSPKMPIPRRWKKSQNMVPWKPSEIILDWASHKVTHGKRSSVHNDLSETCLWKSLLICRHILKKSPLTARWTSLLFWVKSVRVPDSPNFLYT